MLLLLFRYYAGQASSANKLFSPEDISQTAVTADPYEALAGLGHGLGAGGQQPVLRGEQLLHVPVDIEVLAVRCRRGAGKAQEQYQ